MSFADAAASLQQQEEAGDDHEHGDVEAEVTAHFEPVVKLQIVQTKTGEEGEECLYKQRSKLYRFNTNENEWKERGTGDVKILQDQETKKCRIILRQEKTMKLCVNHIVPTDANLTANMGSDRAWTWVAQDFSDEKAQIWTFAIKFKTPEIANEFKAEFDKAKVINGGAESAASPKKEGAPAEEKKGREDTFIGVLRAKRFKPLKVDTVKGFWTGLDASGKGLGKGAVVQVLEKVAHEVFSSDSAVTVDAADKIKAKLPAIAEEAIKGKEVLTWDEFAALPEIKAATN